MTQIDFYLVPGESVENRLRFACRLTDKAYRLGNRVFIHTESAQQTRLLDDLLWTFQQNSFVPHSLYQDTGETPAPVLLAHDAEPDAGSQVLINLAAEVPLFFSRFERVVEIVDQDENQRQQARERFKFYRDRGYDLHTHNLNH